MNSNAHRIWQTPVYLPYLQPALTNEAISNAEKFIGYVLPPEYLELLRQQNGGYIRYSLPGTVHRCIAGIGPHYPSLLHFDWEEAEESVSFELNGLVPFDGDGHWHLCLDYRSNPDQPSVTHVSIEADSQREVAASFSAYLGMLELKVSDDLVTDSVEVNSLLSSLTTTLGTEFEPPDSWAHGYPVYRAAMGNDKNPEWIWISPNRVPRGFVRDDNDRYEELKNMLPGDGLRYPEISETSLMIQITTGVRRRVIDALRESRIRFSALRELVSNSKRPLS